MLGAIAGSLVSGLIGRSNQEDAQDHAATVAQNKYQWMVQDMQKAGLNPMLSYSLGANATPSPAIAHMPDLGSSYNQATTAAAASKQADTAESVGNATVSKTKQEIVNLQSANAQVLQATDNLRIEYQNLVKQGLNLTEVGNQIRKTIDKMDSEIKLIGNQTLTEHFRKFLTENQAKTEFETQLLRKAEAEIAGVEARGAQSFGEVGNTVKHLRPFLELLWNATKR